MELTLLRQLRKLPWSRLTRQELQLEVTNIGLPNQAYCSAALLQLHALSPLDGTVQGEHSPLHSCGPQPAAHKNPEGSSSGGRSSSHETTRHSAPSSKTHREGDHGSIPGSWSTAAQPMTASSPEPSSSFSSPTAANSLHPSSSFSSHTTTTSPHPCSHSSALTAATNMHLSPPHTSPPATVRSHQSARHSDQLDKPVVWSSDNLHHQHHTNHSCVQSADASPAAPTNLRQLPSSFPPSSCTHTISSQPVITAPVPSSSLQTLTPLNIHFEQSVSVSNTSCADSFPGQTNSWLPTCSTASAVCSIPRRAHSWPSRHSATSSTCSLNAHTCPAAGQAHSQPPRHPSASAAFCPSGFANAWPISHSVLHVQHTMHPWSSRKGVLSHMLSHAQQGCTTTAALSYLSQPQPKERVQAGRHDVADVIADAPSRASSVSSLQSDEGVWQAAPQQRPKINASSFLSPDTSAVTSHSTPSSCPLTQRHSLQSAPEKDTTSSSSGNPAFESNHMADARNRAAGESRNTTHEVSASTVIHAHEGVLEEEVVSRTLCDDRASTSLETDLDVIPTLSMTESHSNHHTPTQSSTGSTLERAHDIQASTATPRVVSSFFMSPADSQEVAQAALAPESPSLDSVTGATAETCDTSSTHSTHATSSNPLYSNTQFALSSLVNARFQKCIPPSAADLAAYRARAANLLQDLSLPPDFMEGIDESVALGKIKICEGLYTRIAQLAQLQQECPDLDVPCLLRRSPLATITTPHEQMMSFLKTLKSELPKVNVEVYISCLLHPNMKNAESTLERVAGFEQAFREELGISAPPLFFKARHSSFTSMKPETLRNKMKWLKAFAGLENTIRFISREPHILGLSTEYIKNHVEQLTVLLDVPQARTLSILVKTPKLLSFNVARMAENMAFLSKELELDHGKVVSIVFRFPSWLSASLSTLEERILALQAALNTDRRTVAKCFQYAPSLLGYNPMSIQKKIELLREAFGLSEDEACRLFQRVPSWLTMSTEAILNRREMQPKLLNVSQEQWVKLVTTTPSVFNYKHDTMENKIKFLYKLVSDVRPSISYEEVQQAVSRNFRIVLFDMDVMTCKLQLMQHITERTPHWRGTLQKSTLGYLLRIVLASPRVFLRHEFLLQTNQVSPDEDIHKVVRMAGATWTKLHPDFAAWSKSDDTFRYVLTMLSKQAELCNVPPQKGEILALQALGLPVTSTKYNSWRQVCKELPSSRHAVLSWLRTQQRGRTGTTWGSKLEDDTKEEEVWSEFT